MSISSLTGGLNLNIPSSMQTSVTANNPLLLNNPFLPGNNQNSLLAPSTFPPAGQDQALMEMVINLLQHLIATFMGGGATDQPSLLAAGSTNAATVPLKEGEERYQGLIINTDSFEPGEVDDLKETLDAMADDPDGAKLMKSLVAQGYRIEKDRNLDAIATAGGGVITIGPDALGDKGYLLEVLGHEMVHAAVNDPDTKNQESIGSTLGRRIRYRYEGKSSVYQDENGMDVRFDGSPEAEETSYRTGIRSARVNDAYRDLPENSDALEILREMGIEFDFY
jgi:hypothetical protein